MPTSSPTALDTLLKLAQLASYCVAGLLAFLTYRAAKRGLLNTVNTEYKKRVMDRLQKLSEDLYSEFDETSELYWAKSSPVTEGIERINEIFERHKADVLAAGEWSFGTPSTEETQRLRRLIDPIESDPFIPDAIRAAVLGTLQKRYAVLSSTYAAEFERYVNRLAAGTAPPARSLDAQNKIHNRVNRKLAMEGLSREAHKAEVRNLRRLMQAYLEGFDPHRPRWTWRERGRPFIASVRVRASTAARRLASRFPGGAANRPSPDTRAHP